MQRKNSDKKTAKNEKKIKPPMLLKWTQDKSGELYHGQYYRYNFYCENCGARIALDIPQGIEVKWIVAKIAELKANKDFADFKCNYCGCKAF